MKATKILIWSLLLVLPATASASQWAKTFGATNETINSIRPTSDSGYIVAGSIEVIEDGVRNRDAWIVKLDSEGSIQWQKRYGGKDIDIADSIQQTTDGGFIVSGVLNLPEPFFELVRGDTWVFKLDSQGNIQWQKTYALNYGPTSVQQTADNGYIVTSGTSIFKLDGSGNIRWQKMYNRDALDNKISAVQPTTDGGYIAAGYIYTSTESGLDAWVLKLDANGNIQWQKTYGGKGYDFGVVIRKTEDGGYIMGGTTANTAWLLKLDGNGNIQWQKAYSDNGHDAVHSLELVEDGGYVIGIDSTYYYGALLKLDGNGSIQWQRRGLGSGSIQRTVDSDYITVGGSSVQKRDSNGNVPGCADIGTINAMVPIEAAALGVNSSSLSQDTSICPLTSNAIVTYTNIVAASACDDRRMDVPTTVNNYSYSIVGLPVFDPDPVNARPLADGPYPPSLNLQVGFLQFAGPVDIYLGIFAPVISPDIWLIKSDNSLLPSSLGFAKWKESTLGPINEALFGSIEINSLPKGIYNLYAAITPAGRFDAYYLWTTFFEVP